jgi:hypothetical protein
MEEAWDGVLLAVSSTIYGFQLGSRVLSETDGPILVRGTMD